MVTWIGADLRHPVPDTLVKAPIRNANGQKVSHQDDQFHIYAIEWHSDRVLFFIDGVLQQTIHDPVPDRPTRVIIGLRQMPWAGTPDWEDHQTMLIDWISIEPLK